MQTYAEILPVLYELLSAFSDESQQKITEDTNLVGDLGLNSLKIMDLLMEIEDRFDVTIPLNRLTELHTIGDLAALLETLVKRPS